MKQKKGYPLCCRRPKARLSKHYPWVIKSYNICLLFKLPLLQNLLAKFKPIAPPLKKPYFMLDLFIYIKRARK